jgi:starch phosphorylase
MQTVSFSVKPNIPERLKALEEMANNLWLSWNFDAVQLFMRLDYEVWLASRQNPARTLGRVSQAKLEEIARDTSFLAAMDAVYAKYQKYLESERWFKGDGRDVVTYFSMEYGLDVSLPIYSGGLGVLSGDHLKTVSDLGLPLVGIGLLYRQGYFQQYLNPDGFQQEFYPENDWYTMPVRLCRTEQGEPRRITVDVGADEVTAQLWEVRVGKTSLYLLDSNIEENPTKHREITATLYGGDEDMRIRQEILLGVGGIRALKALDLNPAVTHMNEGHSASGQGNEFLRGPSGDLAYQCLHYSHPGAGGKRTISRRTYVQIFQRFCRTARALLEGFPRLGTGESGQRSGEFLYDRPGSETGSACQRRQQASRSNEPQDVAESLAGFALRRGSH